MSPAVALHEQKLPCTAGSQAQADGDIAAQFHRLLEADKQSAEFAALWLAVDAYLGQAIAQERLVDAT